jgi:Galactose binding lectin domain
VLGVQCVVEGGTRVCAVQDEHTTATLSCAAGTLLRSIEFASYGTPTGSCGAFVTSSCNASTSLSVVQSACLNRVSCSVSASNATFGDPCPGTFKHLSFQARCAP